MESAHTESPEPTLLRGGLIDVVTIVLIAVTAVLTAWAAFQHAEWNGIQAENSRLAAAAGVAASRETTIASAQRNVDVGTFLQWLQSVRDDIDAGHIDPSSGPYVADSDTLSGFIAIRFRKEFRSAFDVWIGMRPLVNSSAAATPFELPEYVLAADVRGEALTNEANSRANLAREATQTGEDYVLVTVLFAIGLVFASIAAKLHTRPSGSFILGLACLVVLVAAVAMVSFPVHV